MHSTFVAGPHEQLSFPYKQLKAPSLTPREATVKLHLTQVDELWKLPYPYRHHTTHLMYVQRQFREAPTRTGECRGLSGVHREEDKSRLILAQEVQ